MIPWAHPSPQPKRHLDRFSTAYHRVPIYCTMGGTRTFRSQDLSFPRTKIPIENIRGNESSRERMFSIWIFRSYKESVIPMGRTFHLQSCPFPWGICPLSIIGLRGSLGPPSPQRKRYLAWFSRFCRANYCDIPADTQTLLGM